MSATCTLLPGETLVIQKDLCLAFPILGKYLKYFLIEYNRI